MPQVSIIKTSEELKMLLPSDTLNSIMLDRHRLDASCVFAPIIDRTLTTSEFEVWKRLHTECINEGMDSVLPRTGVHHTGTGAPEDQHLYVLVDADFGAIKIGITKHLATRLYSVRRDLSAPHVFLLAFSPYKGYDIEQEIHYELRRHRVSRQHKRGKEWFWLSGELGLDLWIIGMTGVSAALWQAYSWEPARQIIQRRTDLKPKKPELLQLG